MSSRTITGYELERRGQIAAAKQQLWTAMEEVELTPLEWVMALSEMLDRVTHLGLKDEWAKDAKAR